MIQYFKIRLRKGKMMEKGAVVYWKLCFRRSISEMKGEHSARQ